MNSKRVSLSQMQTVMLEMLESGGTVTFNPRGTSMLPTIMNEGDAVEIKKPDGYLKKYDLPLYIRSDGAFVLHRIVKKPLNGVYTMCGDNQWRVESGIKHSQIMGVVTKIRRKGKMIDADNPLYRAYVVFWVAIMPARHLFFGGSGRVKRLLKKVCK